MFMFWLTIANSSAVRRTNEIAVALSKFLLISYFSFLKHVDPIMVLRI
jgi:hypothetical protein